MGIRRNKTTKQENDQSQRNFYLRTGGGRKLDRTKTPRDRMLSPSNKSRNRPGASSNTLEVPTNSAKKLTNRNGRRWELGPRPPPPATKATQCNATVFPPWWASTPTRMNFEKDVSTVGNTYYCTDSPHCWKVFLNLGGAAVGPPNAEGVRSPVPPFAAFVPVIATFLHSDCSLAEVQGVILVAGMTGRLKFPRFAVFVDFFVDF